MTTTIRIQARNNSDCRHFTALDDVRSARVKHNGGKTMIAVVDDRDIDEARKALDDSRQVASYHLLAR